MVDEKRKHLRLALHSKTFIELVSPDPEDPDSGEIASCQTMDVSRGGLQVVLDRELTVGAILQIGIDLPDWEETLYLAGEVRWCRPLPAAQGQWSAGFQLLNTGNPDFMAWIGLVSEMDS
jgi:hypothetical protein